MVAAVSRESDGTLSVPVTDERVRRLYDRTAAVYARTVARLEARSQRRAVDRLDLSTGATVVDVGCGPGRGPVDLARRVGPAGRVVGVDAAPGMLAAAADRVDAAGVADRVALVRGDARRLPLSDGVADAVVALDVLDLFERADVVTALEECRRVLAPEGRLCVVTMDRRDVPDSTFLRAYEAAYERVPGFATVGCRPIPIADALAEAGLAVESSLSLSRARVWPVRGVICAPA